MRYLSKSLLTYFRQCPKRLWLELYRPKFKQESARTLSGFEWGHKVDQISRLIYDPDKRGQTVDLKALGFFGAMELSQRLLAACERPVFEAGFKAGYTLAFSDVMLPVGPPENKTWRMIEVKSSTKIYPYQLEDIAIQTFIAQRSGIKLQSASIACVDYSWKWSNEHRYRGFLYETDVTAQTFARHSEVQSWVDSAQTIACQSQEPEIQPGKQCCKPFECSFSRYCQKGGRGPLSPATELAYSQT